MPQPECVVKKLVAIINNGYAWVGATYKSGVVHYTENHDGSSDALNMPFFQKW